MSLILNKSTSKNSIHVIEAKFERLYPIKHHQGSTKNNKKICQNNLIPLNNAN